MNGLGRFGESWSAGYLTRQGYRVIERNVRMGGGEIDLVAWDGPHLVFVEVKCRRSSRFGRPEEHLSPSRFARLVRAIEEYVATRAPEDVEYRVDVLALEVDTAGRVARHAHLKAVSAPD